MKFRKKYIGGLLLRFGISGKPIKIQPLLEAVGKPEARYVLRAYIKDGRSYVVKLTCAKRFPHERIERQSRFSEQLRRNGIQTPRRYAAGGAYCVKCKKRGFDFSVTVEDYAGAELKLLDMPTARELGALLARCHEISRRENCLIGAPTIFDIAGRHEMSAYSEFRALGGTPGIDSALHSAVLEAYDARLERALSGLAHCPRHAVQGDLAINNLSRQNGQLCMFDYNCAGDDYLAADMISQGLYISTKMEYAQSMEAAKPHDPGAMFGEFMQGYTGQRQLSEAELCAADDYYAVSAAMWASEITEGENCLPLLLQRGDFEAANRRLSDMLAGLGASDALFMGH